jgi:thiol:disulfide interchange protein DsbD
LLIFGTMGLGLASPFLLLSIFPKLVAYLPKPGVWMESVKQFMGFLLMAAVVFLALVAGRSGGVDAVIALLIALLVVSVAAWVYGRWSVPVKAKRTQWIARFLSLALLAFSTVYAISETKAAYEAFETGSSASESGHWAPWSAERVAAELEQGNPVFIDFTASWCLICQVNKKVATHTDATEALFEEYGVTTLEADWTRYDSAITGELERFGRSGVPLYVLYAPNGEVTVLPQSLTNGIVREAVEAALR